MHARVRLPSLLSQMLNHLRHAQSRAFSTLVTQASVSQSGCAKGGVLDALLMSKPTLRSLTQNGVTFAYNLPSILPLSQPSLTLLSAPNIEVRNPLDSPVSSTAACQRRSRWSSVGKGSVYALELGERPQEEARLPQISSLRSRLRPPTWSLHTQKLQCNVRIVWALHLVFYLPG